MLKKILLSFVFIEVCAVLEASACSVCFGDPESKLTSGLQMGVLTLLAIVLTVLSGFAVFFFYLYKRHKSYYKNKELELSR